MALKKPTQTFLSFIVLSIIYLVLVIVLPPNTATIQNYHLSSVEFRILSLLLGLPRVVVWFAAFYGYARLDQYAMSIKKTADGQAFAQISRGLRWLAWGLPVGNIVSNLVGGIAYAHPGFLTTGIITNHLVEIIISVVAFTIIGTGTRQLVEAVHKEAPIAAVRGLMVAFLILAIEYCYVTIRSVQTQSPNPYRLPMWLILLTVVIPYLYAWLMGLLASYEISLYRKHIKGVLYQNALNLLASGMGLAIIASVVLQYVTSTTNYLRRIEFNWELLIVYIVLILYAAGFALIAFGANKLKKIEEV